MQITEKEIKSVEDIGNLNGNPVKLLTCKGGFVIALGRKKGKLQDEALAAGSHPALVKYNLEKENPSYQPNLMKSEGFIQPQVDKHSHFLSDDLRKSGHDIYSVQDGSKVDFIITKHNVTLSTVKTSIDNGDMVISNLNIPKEFSRALAGATTEKGMACGASKIKLAK